ncbi:hypothetical protein PanWU01x14_304040, partial [Parasponia andersonii]
MMFIRSLSPQRRLLFKIREGEILSKETGMRIVRQHHVRRGAPTKEIGDTRIPRRKRNRRHHQAVCYVSNEDQSLRER